MVKGFRLISQSDKGDEAFKHLGVVNLPNKIICLEPKTIEFELTGRLKLFVKEGDIRRILRDVLILWDAYEVNDYKIEVIN